MKITFLFRYKGLLSTAYTIGTAILLNALQCGRRKSCKQRDKQYLHERKLVILNSGETISRIDTPNFIIAICYMMSDCMSITLLLHQSDLYSGEKN